MCFYERFKHLIKLLKLNAFISTIITNFEEVSSIKLKLIMELSSLPEEMIDRIVSFATLNSLKNLSRVSKFMFYITNKHISNKCVINPNRQESEKELCDLQQLQRTYFNVKLEKDLQISLENLKIIPKNLYLMKVSHSSKAFVNTNLSVRNVYIHIEANNLENPLTAGIPRFDREVNIEVFSLKLEYKDRIDMLLSWIYHFQNLKHLHIFMKNPNKIDKDWAEKSNFSDKSLNIKRLVLSNVKNQEFLQSLINKCPKLKYLEMIYCKVGNIKLCQQIREFIIWCAPNLSKENKSEIELESVEHLLQSQNLLESVSFKEINLTKKLLELLDSMFLSNITIKSCHLDSYSQGLRCLQRISNVSIEENVRHEDKLIEMLLPYLENVEVLSLRLMISQSLPRKYLPLLKHLVISGKGSKKIMSNLRISSLETCSISGFIDWIPNCQNLIVTDKIEFQNSKEIFETMKEYYFSIDKIFMKMHELQMETFHQFLNFKNKDAIILIDFSPYFAYKAQSFEDAMNVIRNMENIKFEESKEEKKFIIFNENVKIIFHEKPVDRNNARGIFARWNMGM